MARTHSSYTASPTRTRSPRRSPTRRPSKDGSEYEMDLDALGLNSTFESTELQASYEPPVDRVDTSEIEGPEDFTMNMTYWMTADLPLAQIKSRKEAKGRVEAERMDAMRDGDAMQNTTEEGSQVIVESDTRTHNIQTSNSASPTRCANGTTDERNYSTPASERSMENDEKVRSFLSNLPDTDMEGAITGTPLHIPKQSFLQIPRSSPPKARSLQPTVEDYDTPRKPTQETVIHHTSAIVDTHAHDTLHDQIAELQSRLGQQELLSKTRITELETILAYTRSELEGARTENYKQKERTASLERGIEQQKAAAEIATSSAEARWKAKEEALDAKMHEYGEEMRLQTLAKLQNQREDYERQMEGLKESKRLVEDEVDPKSRALEQARNELAEVQRLNGKLLNDARQKLPEEQNNNADEATKEHDRLKQQLSSVQARADDLQARLATAMEEARAMRQSAERSGEARNALESKARVRSNRISELETNLQAAHFELECAQADIAAKQQLFKTNLDLNSRLRTLQSELNLARTAATTNDQQDARSGEVENRIASLQDQLQTSRADALEKDQELLKRIRSEERLEQSISTAQGRIEGLDATITTLRQQLAEAHRESAKARTNSERLKHELEDVNDRLHDSRMEADRRVKDVELKLSNLKELKAEAERSLRELQSQHDDHIEGHEAMLADVRDKAEDAVKKASTLVDRERSEKRRLIKELKEAKETAEKSHTQVEDDTASDDKSSDDSVASTTSAGAKEKEAERQSLRYTVRKQTSEMKVLSQEIVTLRKENKKSKTTINSFSDLEANIAQLKNELNHLRAQNADLQSSLEDQEAVNAAMDEKLATVLSKLMKERAKTVVGKRDGQWQASVGQVQSEKELLGKVLLRQWGREEVGIADEKHGEQQGYQYKYVKRERA
ncbi:hypothetical protein DE146DRAFT_10067 [Phaeosphaeria sp. MPI-PUGE-AT-0046c]|nr:hypothetical protein DE146DRAFT_10067 [Phaeosphaeria sp. MPI-PUGE-AT-0046c]